MSPPPLRITKVKIESAKGKKDRIVVRWQVDSPTGEGVDEYSVESYDTPHDSLYDSLKALVPFVLETFETSEVWDEDAVKVLGVSFTHRNDILGAVVTALKKREGKKLPNNINTPHQVESCCAGDESDCIDDETVKLLRKVIHEGYRYVTGDRKTSQLSIPLESPDQIRRKILTLFQQLPQYEKGMSMVELNAAMRKEPHDSTFDHPLEPDE